MANRDATAIWSGYNHQGKVGLFVALREMANLAENAPYDSITVALFGEWHIEFEQAEDFDIYTKPPCADPNYIHSRHQVKAHAGQDGRQFSKYKKVVAPYTITRKDGNVDTMPGFDKSIKDEYGNVLTNELPANKRYIHLVQSVQSWKNDVENNPNQVSPYTYPEYGAIQARDYCGLSDSNNDDSSDNGDALDHPLDEAAYAQMQKVLPGRNRSELKLVWMALQVELQRRIATRHNDRTAPCPRFSFRDIFENFLNNNLDLAKFKEDYRADIFRRRLINLWAKIQSRYEHAGGIDNAARSRINTWLGELHKKDDEELKRYIDSLSPNEQMKPNDIHAAGFSEVVCATMRQVGLTPSAAAHEYTKDGMPYSLTTITDDPTACTPDSLRREISEAIDASGDNLYKQCTLVTKNHDFDFLESRFTDQLEYNEESIHVKTEEVAGVRVPNVKDFQPRRVVSVANAVIELNERNT